MRAMEQLFRDQPPEKQEEMMKQALEFQKTIGKIPGFGKLAQKNVEVMEQLLKTKQGEPTQAPGTFGGTSARATARNVREMFTPPPSSSSHRPPHSSPKGPTLDDLKKVNLGPEIEALFDELKVMRNKKNEYRDKYHKALASLETSQNELNQLRSTESNLREKLKLAEQNVMLLTSENMQLQEVRSDLKSAQQEKKELKRSLKLAQEALQSGTAAGSQPYETLAHQLQSKEESLRSLLRKMDRMRRRDPLLQFSLACNDITRLCQDDAAGYDPGRDEAETAFQLLSQQYHEAQQETWKAVAAKGSIAAKAYVAAIRRTVAVCIPYAYYDAAVTVEGDVGKVTSVLKAAGFIVQAVPEDPSRLHVLSATDSEPLNGPGPYGYLFALRYATSSPENPSSSPGDSLLVDCNVVAVSPYVSVELVENGKRSTVSYETARASGPGGQATNVTETQVYAKLEIDGQTAFTAEAQDSRSALSNKESALEKLKHARRTQYNDTLSKKQKSDEVYHSLVEKANASGGITVDSLYLSLVQEAVAAGELKALDEGLVRFISRVAQEKKEN